MKKQRGIFQNVLSLLYAGLVAGPLLVMLVIPAARGAFRDLPLELMLPQGRRLALFVRSLTYSASVSLALIPIGLGAAYTLHIQPALQKLKAMVFLLLLLPPYLHATAWMDLLNGLGKEGKAGVVIALSQLPLMVGLCLIGFSAVPRHLAEAAKTLRDNARVFTRIFIPLCLPYAAAGACLVFLSVFMDYTVPSMVGSNTYAMEIFTDFSAAGDAARSLLLSVPAMVVGSLVLLLLCRILKGTPLRVSLARYEGLDLRLKGLPGILTGLGALVLAVQILVPLIRLPVMMAGQQPFQTVLASGREYGGTLLISAGTALAVLFPAMAAASRMARRSVLFWLLCALPFVIPPSFTGIAVSWISQQVPGSLLYGTWRMPVLACASRFAPCAAIVLAVLEANRDPLLLEAEQVYRKNILEGWWRIRLPLKAAGIGAAMLLVAVFSAGELGATLLVVPPGLNTITMKIYNLMHYGAYGNAATLCFTILLAAAAAGAGTGLLIRKRREARYGGSFGRKTRRDIDDRVN